MLSKIALTLGVGALALLGKAPTCNGCKRVQQDIGLPNVSVTWPSQTEDQEGDCVDVGGSCVGSYCRFTGSLEVKNNGSNQVRFLVGNETTWTVLTPSPSDSDTFKKVYAFSDQADCGSVLVLHSWQTLSFGTWQNTVGELKFGCSECPDGS